MNNNFEVFKRALYGSFDLEELSVSSMIPYTIRKTRQDLIEIEFKANNMVNNYVSLKNYGSEVYSEILNCSKPTKLTLFSLGSAETKNFEIDSNMLCNIWENNGEYSLLTESIHNQNKNYVSVSNKGENILNYEFLAKKNLLVQQDDKNIDNYFGDWIEKMNIDSGVLMKENIINEVLSEKKIKKLIKKFRQEHKIPRTFDAYLMFKLLNILKVADEKLYEKKIKIEDYGLLELIDWYNDKAIEDINTIIQFLNEKFKNEKTSENDIQGTFRQSPLESFKVINFDYIMKNLKEQDDKSLGYHLLRYLFNIVLPYFSFPLSLKEEDIKESIKIINENETLKKLYIDFIKPHFLSNISSLLLGKPGFLGFYCNHIGQKMNEMAILKKGIKKGIEEPLSILTTFYATLMNTILLNFEHYDPETDKLTNFQVHYVTHKTMDVSLTIDEKKARSDYLLNIMRGVNNILDIIRFIFTDQNDYFMEMNNFLNKVVEKANKIDNNNAQLRMGMAQSSKDINKKKKGSLFQRKPVVSAKNKFKGGNDGPSKEKNGTVSINGCVMRNNRSINRILY